MNTIFSFLLGKKTYLVAIVGLIYGLIHGDANIVEVSILAMTGRSALNGVVAKIQGVR